MDLMQNLRRKGHHERILNECSEDGIYWHFNPPSAPHFSGLWEAAVRSAKIHLLKVLGQHVVLFEDLQTLLTQVEACLNSRPLTALSDDPMDLKPLTPGHCSIGASLQAAPDCNYVQISEGRLKCKPRSRICNTFGAGGK
ncbi:uncharacterized protein LOC129717290 [Wyeomyia smithii]|uniref:uncharacterized protein LOC129717290 n=1 Tax=Wyeomyia smithii TaxID=174621 RepID=UPI002467F86A|nr:uncharacterized protein LOC129717290 [Wyeomyia smithii]